MTTNILIPEHCPICAALTYGLEHASQEGRAKAWRELRAHQRRHVYGFYTAMCATCAQFLGDLSAWRDLSDDQVLRIHSEYETHFELAHQRAGLVQLLFPGGQVTTGRKPG